MTLTDEQKVTLVTRNEGVAWLEIIVLGVFALYVVHPEPIEEAARKLVSPIKRIVSESAAWWRTKEAIDALPETDT